MLVIIILVIFGYFLSIYRIIGILKVVTSLVALSFFGVGYLFKLVFKYTSYFNKYYTAVLALVISISFLMLNLNYHRGSLDMNYAIYRNLIYSFISGIAGIYLVLMISYKLQRLKIAVPLKYIGKNTVWFFPLSAYIPVTIISIIDKFTFFQVNVAIKLASKFFGFLCIFIIIESRKIIILHIRNKKYWIN
jgi:hypothetical protein